MWDSRLWGCVVVCVVQRGMNSAELGTRFDPFFVIVSQHDQQISRHYQLNRNFVCDRVTICRSHLYYISEAKATNADENDRIHITNGFPL